MKEVILSLKVMISQRVHHNNKMKLCHQDKLVYRVFKEVFKLKKRIANAFQRMMRVQEPQMSMFLSLNKKGYLY